MNTDDAKIKEIHRHSPNQRLIDYAKTLLADAESGTLQSICGVVIFENGNTADIWVSAPEGYPLHLHSDRLIGCLERVQFQLMAHRHGLDTEDTFVAS